MAGVYLSWPFCAQKCTFCNFASGVFPAALERDYESALTDEIARFDWPWRPETIYLGGGTPSRMPAATLERLLGPIPGRPWREATIEAAPGTVTAEWARLGIDRVSLGVQSFVPREIAQTGRKHTAEVVEREMRLLREHGIRRFNIDLIAGLAYQTRESWRESLEWVERLDPGHVSVYMLEVDQDSGLGSEILRGGAKYGAAAVLPATRSRTSRGRARSRCTISSTGGWSPMRASAPTRTRSMGPCAGPTPRAQPSTSPAGAAARRPVSRCRRQNSMRNDSSSACAWRQASARAMTNGFAGRNRSAA
jgi:hypothetical protein